MARKLTGWSQSGTITPGQTNQRVGLQIEFDEPGNYTIQFEVDDPNDGLAIGNRVLFRAEIIWKVAGNQVRRIMDVGDGVSITGTGEAVSVRVFDSSTIIVAVQAAAVTINVAKGTRASVERPPIFSLPETALGPGADSEVIALPDSAGVIGIMVTVFPNTIGTAIGAYDVEVFQAANSAGSQILNRYDPRQSDWVPVVAGARSIVLATSAAAPLVNFTPILGIDG